MPEKPRQEAASVAATDPDAQAALEYIQQAVQGLRFGEVTVIVQDGVVVQVERTEKKRFDRTIKKH